MQKLFIITGVNGIGKSSVIPELRRTLNPESFVVHDFDERGVPDNADREWRKSETKHWFSTAKLNQNKNLSTVVCGFMKVSDISYALENVPDITISVCVLNASPETISRRILSRYTTSESVIELERATGKTPEKFASDSVWIAPKFKEEAIEKGYHVLDTDELTPDQVATNIISWMEKNNQ
jgi:RNase adaptor protein for sRNA GlmZ degradation